MYSIRRIIRKNKQIDIDMKKESENKKDTIKHVPFDKVPVRVVDSIEEYARENGYIPLEELLERINRLILVYDNFIKIIV